MTSSSSSDSASARRAAPRASVACAWGALAVALAGLGGSLFLSLGLHLEACPLCFYQRTFAMSLVAILGMGLLTGAARPERLSLLGLPLAAAGLGVALFHVRLELVGKLECPDGLWGLGTAPKQSLAVFAVLFVLLLGGVVGGRPADPGTRVGLPGGIVLGALLALASCTSNPPPPPVPGKPYSKPPEVCRPPFRAPAGQ